jgi:hypothetical protein
MTADSHQPQPEAVAAAAWTAVHPADRRKALQHPVRRTQRLIDDDREISGTDLTATLKGGQNRIDLRN